MLLVLIFRISFILLQDEQSGTRRTVDPRFFGPPSKKFATVSKCPFLARHCYEGWKKVSAKRQQSH